MGKRVALSGKVRAPTLTRGVEVRARPLSFAGLLIADAPPVDISADASITALRARNAISWNRRRPLRASRRNSSPGSTAACRKLLGIRRARKNSEALYPSGSQFDRSLTTAGIDLMKHDVRCFRGETNDRRFRCFNVARLRRDRTIRGFVRYERQHYRIELASPAAGIDQFRSRVATIANKVAPPPATI